jgi:hypothetical protein
MFLLVVQFKPLEKTLTLFSVTTLSIGTRPGWAATDFFSFFDKIRIIFADHVEDMKDMECPIELKKNNSILCGQQQAGSMHCLSI